MTQNENAHEGQTLISRRIDAAPKRSASATWSRIVSFIVDVLATYDFAHTDTCNTYLIALAASARQLIWLRVLRQVELHCEATQIVIDVQESGSELNEKLDLPLICDALPPESCIRLTFHVCEDAVAAPIVEKLLAITQPAALSLRAKTHEQPERITSRKPFAMKEPSHD